MAEGEGGRERDNTGQRVVPADEVSKIVSEQVNRVQESNQQVIAELRRSNDELRESLKQKGSDKKTYTRAELDSAVEKGVISQEKADAIFDQQREERLTKTITETVLGTVQKANTDQALQSEIDKYLAFDPDLNNGSSEANRKVRDEIATQMRLLGTDEQTLAIELNALRTVYGPSSLLDKTPEARERDTHQDTTATGHDDAGEGDTNKDGSPKGLTKAQRTYYQDQITKGRYRDWKAVAAELKYQNPELSKRVAARD